MKCPKNGFCLFPLAILLILSLNGYGDFSSFDNADAFHSPQDTGSIEEFTDSRLPQPAILRASENLRHTARQSKTNNPGLNQSLAVSPRYDADAMMMIKESKQLDIKNGIHFKLRI
ncbi:MAG: hypothetical protein LBJ90_04900 [Treponema sp.]|nr:hypothetical protein [Treponema sp.]